MSASPTCAQCGTALPSGAPSWLCPKCLLGCAAEPDVSEAPPSAETPAPVSGPGEPPGDALPYRLGPYELLARIGHGGMGVVYKARQISLDRLVAVKVLSLAALGSLEIVHRFRTEAVTAGSLQHPNIVAVHEVGLAEGQHYLVMEYVPGPTLADLTKREPLPARRAAQYLRTIAEAVHFAHERGILHRDLKPSNVLIDANDQPRVTDFGLAKRLETSSELTLSGQVLGSPAFIPPEQASGQRGSVGRRSDVYALGAILYFLLTGRPPFVGEALADTLGQVLNQEPVELCLLNPAVPLDLQTICLKCLAKEPDRRYSTAQALAEELGRFLEHRPILARPLGPTDKARRWCRRNPRLAFATSAALLSLLLGFVGVTWQWRQADSQRTRAEAEALLNRRNVYAADMNLVQRELEDSDLGSALGLLNRHRPARKSEVISQKAELDLCGWEWRYLWARCRSDERFTLYCYSNAVSALAFSSDGKWLAVRREDGGVSLWDAVAKRPAGNLAGAGLRSALAFSPRTNLLAWGNRDANGAPVVSLWDLSTKKEVAGLSHVHKILSIAFSPDGKQIAALAFNGTLRVWDTESGKSIADFPTAPDDGLPSRYSVVTNATVAEPIWSDASGHYGHVLMSPDGHWLAVGEAKPRIRLFDRATGKEREPIALPAPADGITALAFSPDSNLLAAGCGYDDKNVHVWDLAADTHVALPGHRDWIAGLAFSPDGQKLASVSSDQTLRFWDVAHQAEPRRFQGHTDEVRAIAWSPDGRDLVTGAADGSVRYWDPAAQPLPAYAVLPPVWWWALAFLPDGKSFLAVTRPNGLVGGSVVRLEARWDAPTVQEVERLSFLGTNHTSLDLSRDGRWLALGDWEGHIQVWDFRESRQVTNLVVPDSRIFGLLFSAGSHFFNCGAFPSGGRLAAKFWEVPTWREIILQNFDPNAVSDVNFRPDERTVAIGMTDGTAVWWDLLTGRRQATLPALDAICARVRFSADGSLFAVAGMNGVLTVREVGTLRPTPILRGHGRAFHDLAFSPDGRRLMASGTFPSGVVQLWDVETGREVLTLPGESGLFSHIGFSPDGNTLFAVSPPGGPALLWSAPSWEEIEAIERKEQAP